MNEVATLFGMLDHKRYLYRNLYGMLYFVDDRARVRVPLRCLLSRSALEYFIREFGRMI